MCKNDVVYKVQDGVKKKYAVVEAKNEKNRIVAEFDSLAAATMECAELAWRVKE